MRALRLDYRRARVGAGWGLALLGGGIALVVASALHVQALQEEVAGWEARVGETTGQGKRTPPDKTRVERAESIFFM